MKKAKSDNLCAIFLSILLSYLTYVCTTFALTDFMTDYMGHVNFYFSLFSSGNFIENWQNSPYFMWHLCLLFMHKFLRLPLETATAYTSILFVLLSFYILYWMIIKYASYKEYILSNAKAAFITFGLSIAQPLLMFWMDIESFSMNPIHSPTQMCVRPFSLLCLCLVYDIWNKHDNNSYTGTFFNTENGLKRPYIYLTVVLFLSTFAKPTFAEMFIPAVAFIMLFGWIKRLIKKDNSASAYFKNCLKMLYCAIPALLFILLQVVGYIILGGKAETDSGFIITKWWEVWSMFTENVVLSVTLGIAFPLFILLIDGKFFIKDNLGKLALGGYIVGFLEASLLGEAGERLSHGNFLWPMMSGMLLIFTASTLHLLDLENAQTDSKTANILVNIAWIIFCLHVFCGCLYLKTHMGL